jgi:hypothetical protein
VQNGWATLTWDAAAKRRLRRWCSGSGDGGLLPRCHGSGDTRQIADHDSPADPAAQAALAVIPTAVEPITALQHADPAFDPVPEANATLEGPIPTIVSRGAISGMGPTTDRSTAHYSENDGRA